MLIWWKTNNIVFTILEYKSGVNFWVAEWQKVVWKMLTNPTIIFTWLYSQIGPLWAHPSPQVLRIPQVTPLCCYVFRLPYNIQHSITYQYTHFYNLYFDITWYCWNPSCHLVSHGTECHTHWGILVLPMPFPFPVGTEAVCVLHPLAVD